MISTPAQAPRAEFDRTPAAPIAERTKQAYLSLIQSAHHASVAKRTTDWELPAMVSMTTVIDDYFSREDIADTTRKTMRAALLWYIKSGLAGDNEDTHQARLALEQSKSRSGPKPGSKSNKSKVIPLEDLNELLEELYGKGSKSVWSYRTAVWIRAALASGARPIEWLDAQWLDPEKTTLKLRNAKLKMSAPAFLRNRPNSTDDTAKDLVEPKATPPRTTAVQDDHGETYRHVPIAAAHEREIVARHLEILATVIPPDLPVLEREEAFAMYYNTCRRYLNRTCGRLWGNKKCYSLYTMRGQFSANMKAAKGADFTAEVMGHTAADTPSAAYYGKANQAHPMFRGTRKGADPERATMNEAAGHEAQTGADQVE